jgi:hypothetical protein
MNEYLTDIFIAGTYLAGIKVMVLLMAFVCGLGDLGLLFLGWLDAGLQAKRAVEEPPK